MGRWKRRIESNENIIHKKHAHMSGVESTSVLSQKSTNSVSIVLCNHCMRPWTAHAQIKLISVTARLRRRVCSITVSSAIVLPNHMNNIGLPQAHPRLNLPQTLAHPQNAINKQSIRRPPDLEVAEECIRPEESKDLIQWVV